MSMRSRLCALAGVLAAAGAGAAKPPELPVGPLVEGVEPTPLAREFYQPDVRGPEFGTRPALPGWDGRGAEASPLVDFITGVRAAVLNRLTIPLGMVPVKE